MKKLTGQPMTARVGWEPFRGEFRARSLALVAAAARTEAGGDDEQAVLARARHANAEFNAPPMADEDVISIVRGAFRYDPGAP